MTAKLMDIYNPVKLNVHAFPPTSRGGPGIFGGKSAKRSGFRTPSKIKLRSMKLMEIHL
jgi:hypothetical protein